MDHIRAIQEVVDEHKESMPTGVVTHVMDECQKAYEATETELYKLTWTTVDSHAHIEHCEDDEDFASVKLSHQIQTLIVEAVEGLVDHPLHGAPHVMTAVHMPHHGIMLKSWLKLSLPRVLTPSVAESGSMYVIHSIVPYEPRKRARDADEA